jgi:hypothetical protein
VSAPRRSFGPNPPGRLAAAMLRALAAELADPGRFTRAKAYARDGAVVDIEIEPGVVRAEVQGSRYDPYLTELHVAAADARGNGADLVELVPDRNEIAAACTCPDAAPSGGASCKHVLATLLVLADELTIEPALLTRWRSASRAVSPRAAAEPAPDVLAELLGTRGPLPTPPVLPPRLPVAMPAAAGETAAVLADALSVLRGLPV